MYNGASFIELQGRILKAASKFDTRDLGEDLFFALGRGQFVVEHVDPQIGSTAVEWEVVGITETVDAFLVLLDVSYNLSPAIAALELFEEALIPIRLDRDDILPTGRRADLSHQRGAGIEGIEHKDHVLLGIKATQMRKKAVGRISLTIVLGTAVLLDDRFIVQYADFALLRMHNCCAEHRMIVGNLPVTVLTLHTVGTMHLLGAKVFHPITTHD